MVASNGAESVAFIRPREGLEAPDIEIIMLPVLCARTRVSGPRYHAVGTCRMGVDGMSVVGPDLKVPGVQGLRVIDASVMPTIPRGHPTRPPS